MLHYSLFTLAGTTDRWLVGSDIDAAVAGLEAANTGRENLLTGSWEYSNNGWHDDSTLSVAGVHSLKSSEPIITQH